ncbi:hypothetical protein [Aureliella helgolandensis]|uniref:Uncharacterized protein n=1 Tax=Aureliella helgolandensis TaxID=2527968 RepID=A0A518GHK7_9BACT|nr:hypothetical protein [Aureliella helgolandensis]QDV28064.1 hypothetical protein Q31a_64570 [Aureliella helgolandensis]
MNSNPQKSLIELLASPDEVLRDIALSTLCESYAADDAILENVLAGWKEWGPNSAFPDFPMLSYLPIAGTRVDEVCQLAVHMSQGKPLTDKSTRCAGKLVEQVVRLPASELAPHLERLQHTVAQSKIFFRVSMANLLTRLELATLPADSLAELLDAAIGKLAESPDDVAANLQGVAALEALRRQHPDYMNLPGVLANRPADTGPSAASFRLTLQSLIAFPEPDISEHLAQHLLDQRESVHVNAVEALVRTRSPAAGQVFIEQFPQGGLSNQQWITRGLQRLQADGLALRIAELRAETSDPSLWLMLVIAEARQFSPSSLHHLAVELDRLMTHSEALVNTLNLYAKVHHAHPESIAFQAALLRYLARTHDAASKSHDG